jgi:hypothetical protein
MHATLLAAAAILVRLALPAETPAPPPRASKCGRSTASASCSRSGVPAAPRRAALVLGSHAMHDGFAMVRWHAAGIGPATGSVLWSESVLAEVLMFFVLGPALLRRLPARRAMALAATAGVIRWVVMANTASVGVIALVQPLHGFTFALLHLACMRSIAAVVRRRCPHRAIAVRGRATAVTAVLAIVSGRPLRGAGSARLPRDGAPLCDRAADHARRRRRLADQAHARRHEALLHLAVATTVPLAALPRSFRPAAFSLTLTFAVAPARSRSAASRTAFARAAALVNAARRAGQPQHAAARAREHAGHRDVRGAADELSAGRDRDGQGVPTAAARIEVGLHQDLVARAVHAREDRVRARRRRRLRSRCGGIAGEDRCTVERRRDSARWDRERRAPGNRRARC